MDKPKNKYNPINDMLLMMDARSDMKATLWITIVTVNILAILEIFTIALSMYIEIPTVLCIGWLVPIFITTILGINRYHKFQNLYEHYQKKIDDNLGKN